jgi:elongation factor 1-beta|tara:strand:- start:723 stop:1040 length:318 start_codon:yes stop_codon:yes gene_type:complete
MYALPVILKDQTKMAVVIITLKIMPKSPETDLNNVEAQAKAKIIDFSETKEIKTEQEPVAFGLKALKIIFVMDENKGSTDSLEENIKTIDGVNSVEAVDVRRAIG